MSQSPLFPFNGKRNPGPHVNFIGSPQPDMIASTYGGFTRQIPQQQSQQFFGSPPPPILGPGNRGIASTINFRNYIGNEKEAMRSPTGDPSIIINDKMVGLSACLNDILSRPGPTPVLGETYNICPLSHVPISCPGRGIQCNHAQCFDIREFLLLNENQDDWVCPICGQRLTYENLRFDFYFLSCHSTQDFSDTSAQSSIAQPSADLFTSDYSHQMFGETPDFEFM